MPCPPKMLGCRRGCLHRAMVEDYRSQRDARLALRESGEQLPPAYTSGSSAVYYQLEDHQFDELCPPVWFKDWLVALGSNNRSVKEKQA